MKSCSDCIFSEQWELDSLYCSTLKEEITDRETICEYYGSLGEK